MGQAERPTASTGPEQPRNLWDLLNNELFGIAAPQDPYGRHQLMAMKLLFLCLLASTALAANYLGAYTPFQQRRYYVGAPFRGRTFDTALQVSYATLRRKNEPHYAGLSPVVSTAPSSRYSVDIRDGGRTPLLRGSAPTDPTIIPDTPQRIRSVDTVLGLVAFKDFGRKVALKGLIAVANEYGATCPPPPPTECPTPAVFCLVP
ncbi:hypothetical protein PAPYR_9740 [Paratrimastix pyriformis]|uniref:Uncharacterized protein n=1 Tax=Paratrimastix pyriformis TaxID=342808 RepID=A0ABQ8U9C3_9EUKA|nr:hypothetical protein PAPYR_9740 [Paratrimastix pyriformis]